MLALPRSAQVLLLLAVAPGCFKLRTSGGGGEIEAAPEERRVDASAVAVPAGYRIEVVATGLNMPTGVAFDAAGRPHVVEAGYSYGEHFAEPRVLRVEADGRLTVVARGAPREHTPWNGITFARGAFYIAQGGAAGGGRIARLDPDGTITAIVSDLPSLGDHHTNGPVAGPDGWIYFGQGTATNAGVVGTDNYDYGWLPRHPRFHDQPCADVTLRGLDFESDDPLRRGGGRVVTGAFVPFGTPTEPGQVIEGALPCSGAVMRVRPDGSGLELVAWGFRNPYGLAFSPDGELYLTENGFDVRGSRPVFGAPDYLWKVEPGRWYGWPDFSGGLPVTEDPFAEAGVEPGGALLAELPGEVPRPAARLAVHASANGFDFSRSPGFGHVGDAFVAEFGDMAPKVGKVLDPVGFQVVRVSPDTGVAHGFARNRHGKGPASTSGGGGLERPIAARFDPSGRDLYVVDFGMLTVSEDGVVPRPRTGVLWRIHREGASR